MGTKPIELLPHYTNKFKQLECFDSHRQFIYPIKPRTLLINTHVVSSDAKYKLFLRP